MEHIGWLLPPVGDTTTGAFRSLRSTRREWNVCRPRRLAAHDLMVAMQWSHRRMCLQSHTHHHTSQAFVHCTQHGPAASRAKPQEPSLVASCRGWWGAGKARVLPCPPPLSRLALVSWDGFGITHHRLFHCTQHGPAASRAKPQECQKI